MPEEATRAGSGDEGEEGGARPTGSVNFLTFFSSGEKRQACFPLYTSPFSMSGGFWGQETGAPY